ncbi:hypothetical protein M9Y10_034166 [Tritrichomonas musculus]|uniref:Uncharacterized protein n=1 Tax=Tritrichomonas musculus TaxID=1915356 RepID=A0ABR2KE80_9EUKA
MDEDESNFAIIQKEHQENIRAKLTKFTSNEISFFNAPFPKFFDFNDEMNQNRSHFLDQFNNYSPCFEPKLFSDRIRYKFSKEFSSQDKSCLINFLQTQIDHIKWRNKVIYDRISKPETYPLFSNYYPIYLDSTSKYSEECMLAIQSLQSEFPNYYCIKSIIKYDFFHHYCHFQIDNLLYTFKKFSLVRREEILSIVKESLVKDLIFDLNPASIPTIINQTDDLIDELKRLSSLLDIEFDIYAQDGQHFSYSCEKLYYKTANQTISFDYTKSVMPNIEYPSFLDRLNDDFIKNTPIDESISFSFDNLVKPSENGIDTIIKKFSNPMIKELTRDKVTSFIRLQFCRNKIVLHSIVESIKSIEKVSKEILKEELPNFFNEHFSIFRKIALVVSSSVKSNSNVSKIDNDSLLEIVLDLYDQFYKYKVKVLNALREININSEEINISSIAKRFIEFRPDLIAGNHKSCIQPFQLSVNILKKIGAAIQSLINLQIFTFNEFYSLYGNYFPWFVFPKSGKKFQLNNESFPFSIFEVFPFLKKVVDFLHVSREVVLEVTESFPVRSTRYKPYFEYAIWSQLLNEMDNFIMNLTPESYAFNMKVTEKVSSTMTSPYLNDLDFILKVIDDYKGKNKLKFGVNFRNMILLGWKLQSFLIKSDICMKTYQTQLLKLENNNTQQIIDFSYGDYEFSAISQDWNSNELEKITAAQHRYQIALEVAVRFNNYHLDIDTIQRTLEMSQYETSLQPKAKIGQINRRKCIQLLPSLLFYEPNLIDEKLYSPTFCYITAARSFTDANYVISIYMPYCIRSEITFINILERCFLHNYSDYDIFYTSTNPRDTFIVYSKFNHFLVPTIPQSLLLDRPADVLYQVLRFISTRYQLLKYSQHDIFLSHVKNGDLEEIYHEKLLWSSSLFTKIDYELRQSQYCDDIDFSVNLINREREVFCSKQLLMIFSVLDLTVLPKKDEKRGRKEEEIELYSFEMVKSYLIDMNRKITGSSSFINSSAYVQTYLDQYYYQCNEALRTELVNYKSLVDKQVGDSVFGYSEDKHSDAIYEFSVDSVRFALMRLSLFYLDKIKDPKKVTIDSIITNLTKEILLNGIQKFDNETKIQATYRANLTLKYTSLEMSFLKAKIYVITEQLKKLLKENQIEILKNQFKNEDDSVESVFNSPTTVLKPECYSERIPMKSSQQIFIPPISSLKNQFSEEVQYVKSRFCRFLCNCISKYKQRSIDDEFISINMSEFKESIKELSDTLLIFFDESRFRMLKTWKGYIQNLLYNLRKSSDEQDNLNVFIEYFISRFNNSVYFNLAHKLKDDYIRIAHLRDRENVIIQEQELFEEQETIDIRREFDILVRDLNEEIRKAKLRFIQAKNRFYSASFNSINKIKDDPTYVDKCVRPPITNSPTPPQKEEPKPEENENKNVDEIKKENDVEKVVDEQKTVDEAEYFSASRIKDDLTETKIDLSASEIDDNESSKLPAVSFSPENLDQENELDNSEVEAFPSFSQLGEQTGDPNSIIINSQNNANTVMFTATDKTAIIEYEENTKEEDEKVEHKNEEIEKVEDENEDDEKEKVFQPKPPEQESSEGEMRPTSMPLKDDNSNRPRRLNLRKSSSTNPKANSELAKTFGDATLTARRSINLRKFQSQKKKSKQQNKATVVTDNLTVTPELPESSSMTSTSAISDASEASDTDHQQTREMINNVTDRIEQTKKQIEELQEYRKKLRISTTLSALAVKGIYTRMIEKVAEEKKGYSALLWRGRRLLEEDLKEKNMELKEAYKRLNDADSQIESLQEEIARTKENNVKLLHMKEFNIRQIEEFHKELKKLNYSTDINVSKLIKKIGQKQEELEDLLFEQQQMEECLYYEVREPMMKLDRMRRELTIRRGQDVDERYFRLHQQAENRTNENDAFGNESTGANNELSLAEQIRLKVNEYMEQNEDLKTENDDLKFQIMDLERRISELPDSRKKIINDMAEPEVRSARQNSSKTIFKPHTKKSFRKSQRPATSRNHL